MMIRDLLDVGNDLFFLGINKKAATHRVFFRRQAIGRNAFGTIVKTVCDLEGISGSGTKTFAITHGLRRSLASLILQASHADSSVQMRTGHDDPRSLQIYQNLRGRVCLRQQRDILGSSCVSSSSIDPIPDRTGLSLGSTALRQSESVTDVPADTSNDKGMDVDTKDDREPVNLHSAVVVVSGGNVNVTVNYYLSRATSR